MEKVSIPEARNMGIYMDRLNRLLQDKEPDDIQTIKYATQIKRVRHFVQKISQSAKMQDWFAYDTKIKVYPILDADKQNVLNSFKDKDAGRIENILESLSFLPVNRLSKREKKMHRNSGIAISTVQKFISNIQGPFIIKAHNNEYIEYAYGYDGLIEQWLCIKDETDYNHDVYDSIYAYFENDERYETIAMNPESILYEIDKCKFAEFKEGFKDNRDLYIECYKITQEQREMVEDLMIREQWEDMKMLTKNLPIVSISLREREIKKLFCGSKMHPQFFS